MKNTIKIEISKLALVFDFDGTITQKYVDGTEVPSAISILRSEGILNEVYSQEAYALKEKYHPFETDQNLSLEIKSAKMNEWWAAHQTLLMEHGLNKKDVQNASHHPKLILRSGVRDLFTFAAHNNVPVIIFSASGIGTDLISFFLDKHMLTSTYVHIISNTLMYDENGKVTGFNSPLIHALNKNESTLEYFLGIKNILFEKKQVVLFGDSPHDAEMVDDKNHEIVIRVGLCNEKDIDKKNKILPLFQEKFDIVIEDDGSLESVYELLKEKC